jgi:L-xylulokinase
MGAAVMAGVGSGAMADLASAAERLVKVDRVFQPDPGGVAIADARFGLWRDLITAARPVNAALAARF